MRLSEQEARNMGISEACLQGSSSRCTLQKPKTQGEKPPKKRSTSKSPIQDILWQAVHERWPEAIQEHKGAVPGRRFRLDIAFVAQKTAVEIDGWQFHGKHLADFKKDREKQNLLTINGWKILRFTAEDIRGNLDHCLDQIHQALTA